MTREDLKKKFGDDFAKIEKYVKQLARGNPDAIAEALKAKFPGKKLTISHIVVCLPPRRR